VLDDGPNFTTCESAESHFESAAPGSTFSDATLAQQHCSSAVLGSKAFLHGRTLECWKEWRAFADELNSCGALRNA
jgi:hypothetical protein